MPYIFLKPDPLLQKLALEEKEAKRLNSGTKDQSSLLEAGKQATEASAQAIIQGERQKKEAAAAASAAAAAEAERQRVEAERQKAAAAAAAALVEKQKADAAAANAATLQQQISNILK